MGSCRQAGPVHGGTEPTQARDILGNKATVSDVSRESFRKVTSLLSSQNEGDDFISIHLPIVAVVWLALMATSSAMEATTRDFPLNSTSDCDGLPLIFKAFKEAMKNYKVLSPHYTLSQPTVPREIAKSLQNPWRTMLEWV